MKIYIATDGEYSDYHIEKVFTNKNQAELYCAVHEYFLEEYDADDIHVTCEKKPKRIWAYRNNFEGFKVYSHDRLTFDETEEMDIFHGLIPLDVNIDKEKAFKIISDKYAQWKAKRNNI